MAILNFRVRKGSTNWLGPVADQGSELGLSGSKATTLNHQITLPFRKC